MPDRSWLDDQVEGLPNPTIGDRDQVEAWGGCGQLHRPANASGQVRPRSASVVECHLSGALSSREEG